MNRCDCDDKRFIKRKTILMMVMVMATEKRGIHGDAEGSGDGCDAFVEANARSVRIHER